MGAVRRYFFKLSYSFLQPPNSLHTYMQLNSSTLLICFPSWCSKSPRLRPACWRWMSQRLRQLQYPSSCKEWLWEAASSRLLPLWLQLLSQEGAFYSEPLLPINSPADRSRLILAQPQMSPIWFIPFTGSDVKELSWALHDMYILSGYHLQVVQRPHNSHRWREREEIFKSLHPAVLYAIPSASLRNHFRLIINS